MDKICKAYVSQVKAILPIWSKKEKAFVRKLQCDLYDYCECNNINTIEELYKSYGTPQEVVFEYISLMEPDVISKRINTAKYIKIAIIVILILSTIFTGTVCMIMYSEHKIFREQEYAASIDYSID